MFRKRWKITFLFPYLDTWMEQKPSTYFFKCNAEADARDYRRRLRDWKIEVKRIDG